MQIVKTLANTLLANRLKTNSFFFLIFAVFMFYSSCETKTFPSVSSVSRSWLDAKTSMYECLQKQTDRNTFIEKIDDFAETFRSFLSSPVGTLYKIDQSEGMQSLESVILNTERLQNAVTNGTEAEIFSLIVEIDNGLTFLQQIDTDFSDRSQLHYFYLFFFFTILVIITIAAVWMLSKRLERSQARERRSISFSRETVAAQEEERSRIARELHDTVAQDLWRLSFQADSIANAKDADERSRLCREVVSGQRELMKRVRSICDTLIPPDFSRRGLPDSLRGFCYHFAERTGIVCSAVIEESLDLGGIPPNTQLQCFRIIQECLANIEKHSGANEASVLMRHIKNVYIKNDSLEIRISDNGKGFSPPDRDSSEKLKDEGHYGLWSMFERAALLDGNLSIESSLSGGTVVSLEIPILLHVKVNGGSNI